MNRHWQKIQAIAQLKLHMIIHNLSISFIPAFSMLMVYLLRLIIHDQSTAADAASAMGGAYLLSFGLLFNTVMGGIMMCSGPLAEEKEKHTLRVLMTASVSGLDFFIGSALPVLVIIEVVNVLMIPIAGVAWSVIPWGSFLLISTICALVSMLLGYMTGILSKNQTQAGIVSMPLLLIFTMLPFFRVLNHTLEMLANLTYSGILTRLVDQTLGQGYHWDFQDIAVLLIWLVIGMGLFLYAYRRNGLDSD